MPLTVAKGIETAVLIPRSVLAHEAGARGAARVVPHHDAAFNVGRAALLVAALAGRPERLFAATEDRLHQGYRAPCMPAADGDDRGSCASRAWPPWSRARGRLCW